MIIMRYLLVMDNLKRFKRLLRKLIFLYFNPKTANRKIMTVLLPKELAYASELMDQAKFLN